MLLWDTALDIRGLIPNILFVNCFQLVLSITCFVYNGLWTAQCGAIEWASYGQGKLKSLRVTWPRGEQRSSYYLHLPYRYGIPLTIALGSMHLLISESVFLARLVFYDSTGQQVWYLGYQTVGYSVNAMLVTCCLGTVLIVAQVVNVFRRLNNEIPIHGNQSAVIGALTQPVSSDDGGLGWGFPPPLQQRDESLGLKALQWGIVKQPAGDTTLSGSGANLEPPSGHCTFTTNRIGPPQQGFHNF